MRSWFLITILVVLATLRIDFNFADNKANETNHQPKSTGPPLTGTEAVTHVSTDRPTHQHSPTHQPTHTLFHPPTQTPSITTTITTTTYSTEQQKLNRMVCCVYHHHTYGVYVELYRYCINSEFYEHTSYTYIYMPRMYISINTAISATYPHISCLL